MNPSARILVVDDDDDVRIGLETILRDKGYFVLGTGDGSGALALVRSQRFDLVLLDITLPDGNGLRIAEFLRMSESTTKVIVITGTSGIEHALRSAALGVKNYITKPLTSQYLLDSVDHVLSNKNKEEVA